MKDWTCMQTWSRKLRQELAEHAATRRFDEKEVFGKLQFGFILRIVRSYVPYLPRTSLHEVFDDCDGRDQIEHLCGPYALSNRRIFRFDEPTLKMRTVFEVAVGSKRLEDLVVDPLDGSAIILESYPSEQFGTRIRRVAGGGETSVLIGGLPWLSALCITPAGDQLLASCPMGRIFRWRRKPEGILMDRYPRQPLWTEPNGAVQHICATDDSVWVVGSDSLYRVSLEIGSVVQRVTSLGPFFGLRFSQELNALVYLHDTEPTVLYIPLDDLTSGRRSKTDPIQPREFAKLPSRVADKLRWYQLSDTGQGELRLTGSCGLRGTVSIPILF